MEKDDLKKCTCINLRCVTQSSKDGVPLNQLQNDYKQLLGIPIPFKELGYTSLENFLRDIPDVVCLKKNIDGSLIAQGVADASTAHIAKLISKQKTSKKSKSGSGKPSVTTRTWGNFAKNSHQNLSFSKRDFASFSPNSQDEKCKQSSKSIHFTPAQQELKNSILINLRSVVQSCKDGVPLNRLQNDYRKFIGSNIPIQNLGHNSLLEFIQSIPDVIKLKRDVNDQIVAVGVVDATTAHLFGDSVNSKPFKSVIPSTETCKSTIDNKVTLQVPLEQKAESPSFFKFLQNEMELSELNSVLKHSPSQKKVKRKNQLVNALSEGKLASKEELTKSEPLKATIPTSTNKKHSSSEVFRSETDTTSPNQNETIKSNNRNLPSTSTFQSSNTISTTGLSKEKCSNITANKSSVEKGKLVKCCFNSTSVSDLQLSLDSQISQKMKVIDIMSSDQDLSPNSSTSSVSTNVKSSFKKNPTASYSDKAREVQDQIKNATISPMVWMYFLLYGPSNMKTLRKEILSFHGFPFSADSTEWQRKINIILELPKKALLQCLNLLCIECNPKDSKKKLQDKLIGLLAIYTEESGTNSVETKHEDNEEKNELKRSILGVLNELTPQNFERQVAVLKCLKIKTEEEMDLVVDLIYDRAMTEPNSQVLWANLCKHLAMIKVHTSGSSGQQVNFRKKILTKCQKEFEEDINGGLKLQLKLLDVADPYKREELQFKYDEEKMIRYKYIGNIRFIGELFKLGMLIEEIMHSCIEKLLSRGDEESLEGLCKLLKNIGKELDVMASKHLRSYRMNKNFDQMKLIVEKRSTSSRIRFMLQDVIDLKKNNWVPRKDEKILKIIDHKEAEYEAREQQVYQNMANYPKIVFDSRDRQKITGRTSPSEDGWTSSSKSSKGSYYMVDSSKLKLTKKELCASTLTLSTVSSDVVADCSSCGGSENSYSAQSNKKFALKPKCKIDSDSDSDYTQEILTILRARNHLQQTKELIPVQQGCNQDNFYLQKPASEKVTSELVKQTLLDKEVLQKVDVDVCSKTETSSIISKSTKKRRRKRKKSKIAEKNVALPVTKPVKTLKPYWLLNRMKRIQKEKTKKKLLLSPSTEPEKTK